MSVLFVDSCISQRGDQSRTRKLAEAYLAAWRASHPAEEIETVDVAELDLRPMQVEELNRRDALIAKGELDHPVFALARQFCRADHIVVAAPYWDLSFPTALRAYVEHISCLQVTYHYDLDGCHGDCRASSLVYLTTGGDFEREDSVGVLHWRQLCRMFGIDRFEYVFAGGMDADPARAPQLLEGACELARKLAGTL